MVYGNDIMKNFVSISVEGFWSKLKDGSFDLYWQTVGVKWV